MSSTATLTSDTTIKASPTSEIRSDDDQPRQVPREEFTQFHVTGFKQFFNVPVNPTELLVNALPGYLSNNPSSPSIELKSTNIFTVAAKTSLREITSIYEDHAHQHQRQDNTTTKKTVFVHLGVSLKIRKFVLEAQAKNEATFSYPDQLGWAPNCHAIDPDNSDISIIRKTRLDLSSIVTHLRSLDYDVDISADPSLFVCNWIYFNSLILSQANDTDALFVHVPSTAVVPFDRQLEFVAKLLNTITLLPSNS